MSWLKKVFGSQSSQETKIYYEKKEEKEKKDENKEKMENLQIDDSQIDESQSSQESWWSSWSGLSQKFSDLPKGKKRNWAEFSSNEKEDKWWSSFKSKSSQKNSQESSCFSKKEKKR